MTWERVNRNSTRQFRRQREREAARRSGLEIIEMGSSFLERRRMQILMRLATRKGRRS